MYGDGKVSGRVYISIRDYCTKRHYKCKGCRYSIDKVTSEHYPYQECMFDNCPCSWEDDNE